MCSSDLRLGSALAAAILALCALAGGAAAAAGGACSAHGRRQCRRIAECTWSRKRSSPRCVNALRACEAVRRGRRKRGWHERTTARPGGVQCRCSRGRGKCGRCEARPEDEFALWKTNFGEEYPDAAAESAAYEAWLMTHNEIAEHNSLVAYGESHHSHKVHSDRTK